MNGKLITRDTDYAVRALVYIFNSKERIVSASELVDELKIPRPFLRKILQKLSKAGILKAYKGKGGGFQLTVAAKKVSLIGLIELFQGPVKLTECLFKKKPCPNMKVCPLRKKLQGIEKIVVKELESIKLNLLFDSKL
ncbi:MAG: Rrf2 family transcriptional regulator [Candidatus Omnitrophica bacterium]|nr:Rrf2 family transcriptional regulator [Candidatus Omnitrophota bacterium]MBU1047078.1 Rrf2 family transcriptional regulator [Candidatus Omnitrophota bacterium]MBU1630560.1 Rrf2 family transcriptional regulator [Candidatus Omnitrophota bacterium]MBU1767142.1 Rrf2 family transcriptional regulator [Candidatus Omnitrophota bacterium]MBU1888744.1 Rrf2 family transcriptional regulator [Candidatus Omnitrophota bacterium]